MIHGPGALDFLVCCFSISRHSLEAGFLASLAFLARSSHLSGAAFRPGLAAIFLVQINPNGPFKQRYLSLFQWKNSTLS
jgi:hypothetical protein